MNLQHIVKDTVKAREGLLLVEFNNGLTVGYERKDREVAYGIIQRKNIPYEATKPLSLETQTKTEYSHEAFRFFFDYGVKKDESLNQEQLATVQNLVEPLDIQKIKSVDYATVAQNVGIGLCSPILFPLGIIGTSLSMLTGSKTLGFAGMVGRHSPVLAFHGLKELIEPSKQYMQIGNQDTLTSDSDSKLPAIAVVTQFRGNQSIKGSSSDKFPWLDVILPSGHSWFLTYGPYYSSDINFRRAAAVDKDAYNSSKYFLKADSLVQSQLTALIEEEESFGRKAESFKKEMIPELHRELLKQVGFL